MRSVHSERTQLSFDLHVLIKLLQRQFNVQIKWQSVVILWFNKTIMLILIKITCTLLNIQTNFAQLDQCACHHFSLTHSTENLTHELAVADNVLHSHSNVKFVMIMWWPLNVFSFVFFSSSYQVLQTWASLQAWFVLKSQICICKSQSKQ